MKNCLSRCLRCRVSLLFVVVTLPVVVLSAVMLFRSSDSSIQVTRDFSGDITDTEAMEISKTILKLKKVWDQEMTCETIDGKQFFRNQLNPNQRGYTLWQSDVSGKNYSVYLHIRQEKVVGKVVLSK